MNFITIKADNITLDAKLKLNDSKRFNEKPFLCVLLGFALQWDYKKIQQWRNFRYNAKRWKSIKLVADGSILDVVREPVLFTFGLIKPACFKTFCELETIHYKNDQNWTLKYYILLRRSTWI